MKLIHVTSVLQPFCNFDNVPADTLQYAANRGTSVHNLIHEKLSGKWVPPKAIADDIKGFIASFVKFQNDMILETVFSEKTFISDIYGLTGTVDFGGYLTDRPKDFTILDWKTPINKTSVWGGQLSAYEYLAISDGFDVKRIGSLQLHPQGKTPKMNWYERSAKIFESYLCALTAYRAFKE